MSLYNVPPSVLTHGGGSDKAIAAAVQHNADHHQMYADAVMLSDMALSPLFASREDGIHPRHMHYAEAEETQPVIDLPESEKDGL